MRTRHPKGKQKKHPARSEWTAEQLHAMPRSELIAALLHTEASLHEAADHYYAMQSDDLREKARRNDWLEIYFGQIGDLGSSLAQAEMLLKLAKADLAVEQSSIRGLLQQLDELKK